MKPKKQIHKKKINVLLVVSEKKVCDDLRLILHSAGYSILAEVTTAKQAFSTAKKFIPHLIMMDIDLKGDVDGIEAAVMITDVVDIPIVFIAAKSDKRTLQRAKIVDAYGYIIKPLDEKDVRAALEIALYKHKTERALKESRNWLSTTLRSIGDAVIATNKKGNIEFMNTIAEQLTGWNEEHAIGKKLSSVFSIIHEFTGKKITSPVVRVLREKKIIDISESAVLISKDRRRTYIEDSAAPIFDDHGNISGVVLTFRDVAEKRKAQHAILLNERRFRALVERSSEAFSIVDSKGIILYTTESVTTIIGFFPKEIINRSVFEFIHPSDIKSKKALFSALLSSEGKTISTQIRFIHKDGSWRWIDAVSTNLLSDSAVEGIVINFRDITYRIQSEAALKHSNDRLNLLARVTGEVIGTLSIQKQVREMAEQVKSAFNVDVVIVRTIEENESQLLAAYGMHENEISIKLPARYGLTGMILSSHRAIAIKNIKEAFDVIYPTLSTVEDKTRNMFVSCVGAPILLGHAVIGTIGLYTCKVIREFTSTDLEHLQIVANHIAVAVANNKLFKEIKIQNDLLQQEIKERNRIENDLRRSEERWRSLVKSAPSIVMQIDHTGKILFINHTFQPVTVEEVLGTSVLNFISAEHSDEIKKVISDVFETGSQQTLEISSIGPNNSSAWYTTTISGILEHGVVTSAIIIANDITNLKKKEHQLQEAVQFNHEIITNAGEGITVYDKEFRYKVWNHFMEQMTGIPQEALVDKNAFEIFPHLKNEGVDVLMNRALLGEIVTSKDILYRVPGTIRTSWNITTYAPHRNVDGEIIGVIATMKDISDRKQSEDALRESELRFRSLFENAKDAVFIEDPKTGIIIDTNAEGERLLQRSREEIVGMHHSNLHPTNRMEEAKDRFFDSLLVMSDDPVEFEILRSDGVLVPVEIKSSVIRLDAERMVVQEIFHDITERKNAENSLQEKEERYRAFVEQSSEGIYRTAFDEPIPLSLPDEEQVRLMFERSYIAECNAVMAKMYGFTTVAEAIGARIKDLMIPTDRNNIEYMLEFVQRGYRFFDQESCEIDSIGNSKYYLNNGIGILEYGNWNGIWGTERDVTDRRNAEAAMRLSEEKYRTLFEESKDGIFITSNNGKFLDVNTALVEMFGYQTKDEVFLLDVVNDVYLSAEDRDKYLQQFGTNDYVRDYELVLRRKDGSKVFVLVTAVTERGQDGIPIIIRGTMRDITEKKRLEEQLLQAQKMESIGTLAGGIAHDFNNLLAMILGTAELIKKQTHDQAKTNFYIQKIIEASERGASISKQLLLFSHPEQAELQPLSLNTFITQVTDFFDHFLPKTITVKCSVEETPYFIMGESGQLHQALLNLSLNAKDAMNEQGTLTIGVHHVQFSVVQKTHPQAPECEYAGIFVRDTGIGMDREVRRRIFEPFYSTKQRGKGTGLGLSIVHGIVQIHQGYIDVESERGKGTTFNLYFPLLSIATDNYDRIENKVKVKNTETILVVDDEEILREILKESLSEEGYTVFAASNGVEALEIYKEKNTAFDLIITDLGMPRMGGEELYRHLAKINPEVQVIVSSGYLDSATKSELLKMGIKDVVSKPFKAENLYEIIRTILDRKNLQ